MTYEELIIRAAFAAHKFEPGTPVDRLQASAEAMFPSVVEELAQSVANDVTHPWRSVIRDETDLISSGVEIPQQSVTGKEIIGEYGTVRDGSDDQPLSGGFTQEEIRTFNANVNSWRQADIYAYNITKPRIYHTRPNVIIDVCIFDEAAVAAAIAANQIPIFPDAEGAYLDALIAKLSKGGPPFLADDRRQLAQ